MNQDQSIVNS